MTMKLFGLKHEGLEQLGPCQTAYSDFVVILLTVCGEGILMDTDVAIHSKSSRVQVCIYFCGYEKVVVVASRHVSISHFKMTSKRIKTRWGPEKRDPSCAEERD